MALVSETSKREIRSRVTLEDLLRDYNINLLPAGRRLKALCPFHTEKTPSFHVDPEKQFFHCFGCHEGGDIFRFVQAMHQVDFPQALEMLARRAGIELEYEGGPRGGPAGRTGAKTLLELYDALQAARDFYARSLLEEKHAHEAREYLTRRGISSEMWVKFQLGFSPPEWDSFFRFATRRGVSPEALEKAGLARRREGGDTYYDYFRGRILFPITDVQNRVIGFGGRTLGEDVPKYLNTPRTPLFDKSQVLYGLPQARVGIRREGRVGIVEGYTDAIMAHQAGLDFFVASLGTAFTGENARRLGRLAPRALLVFDGDDAGQRASERSLDLLLAENLDVRIYTVRDGKDPCDAILSLGGDEFRRRFEAEAVGIFEFKWRRTVDSEGARTAGPAVRARALDEFLDLLALVPNVVARKLYLREFSERLGIPEADVETRMRQRPARGGGSPGARPGRMPIPARSRAGEGDTPDGTAEDAEDAARVRGLEEITLECVLALAHRAKEIWARVPAGLFAGLPYKSAAEAVTRRLEKVTGEVPEGLLASSLLGDVEEPEATRALSSILGRIEDENGNPTRDYEEVWRHLERDFQRFAKGRRVAELKRLLGIEKPKGDTEEFLALRREYFDTLKELKKG